MTPFSIQMINIAEYVFLQIICLSNVHIGRGLGMITPSSSMCSRLCGGAIVNIGHGSTPTGLACRVGNISSLNATETFTFLHVLRRQKALTLKATRAVGHSQVFVSCSVPFWRMFRKMNATELDNLHTGTETKQKILLDKTNTTNFDRGPCPPLTTNCWNGIVGLLKTKKDVVHMSDEYHTSGLGKNTSDNTVYGYLRRKGCNLKTAYRNTSLLHLVSYDGKIVIARNLLAKVNYDINERGSKGRSPFLLAASCGRLKMVKYLISEGCDAFLVDHNSRNALHLASIGGNGDVVKFLLSEDLVTLIERQNLRRGRATKGRGQIGPDVRTHAEKRSSISNNGRVEVNSEPRKELQTTKNTEYEVPTGDGEGRPRGRMRGSGFRLDGSEGRYKKFDIESRDSYNRTSVMLSAAVGENDVYHILINKHCNIVVRDKNRNTLLHLAAKGGEVGIVKDLLYRKLDIESRDTYGWTPAFVAIQYESKEVLELLVRRHCNIHAVDNFGYNMLHIAARYDNTDILNYVLDLGFDIESRSSQSNTTALLISTRKGKLHSFEFLYKRGGNTRAETKDGRVLIHKAAKSGCIPMVERVLREKQDVNKKDKKGLTPIFIAARQGHLKVVEYLVGKGAILSALAIKGYTILHWAALSGKINIVEYILSIGGDIESKDNLGRTPLMVAALYSKTNMIDFLLSKGANLHARDNADEGLLHLAAIGRHAGTVTKVLDKGIHIDNRDGSGKTAVMSAAQMGWLESLYVLVRRGADLSIRNKNGNGIMHMAAMKGQRKVIEYLLDLKLDIDSNGNSGRTPAMMAACHGDIKTIDFLVSMGCDLKAKNDDGNTIFHVACTAGSLISVKHLILSYSMDMDSRDYRGRTCVGIAVEYSYEAVYHYLVDLGADLTVVDNSRNNILHLAAIGGDARIVGDLLQRKLVGINARGWHRQTAVMQAARKGNVIAFQLFATAGSNLTMVDEDGQDIMQMAVRGGSAYIVKQVG